MRVTCTRSCPEYKVYACTAVRIACVLYSGGQLLPLHRCDYLHRPLKRRPNDYGAAEQHTHTHTYTYTESQNRLRVHGFKVKRTALPRLRSADPGTTTTTSAIFGCRRFSFHLPCTGLLLPRSRQPSSVLDLPRSGHRHRKLTMHL